MYGVGGPLDFEWDEDNLRHIARHNVTSQEAEQVVSGSPLVLEVQYRGGEQRTLCAGRTRAGRPVAVVFTIRPGRIRVVTAFTANRKLRERL
jgi:hypothetical protein